MTKSPANQLITVLIVSILASFVAFLDSSVVNVALPSIVKELGGGLATQQWVVDAYLLTLSSLILIAGSISDLFGRKRVLVSGLLIFLGASILCALSPTATWLIIARALQGIGGALLVPSSLALIIATFPTSDQGKAIGRWTAWTGISFIVGPLVGGFLVDTASWRWIFGVNVIPIAITLYLLKTLNLSEKTTTSRKIDIWGALLCIVGLGGLTYGFIEQSRLGWHNPLVVTTLLVGVIALVCFIILEQKIKDPMLPLELFKIRNFSVGNVSTLAMYAGLSIIPFILTLFVQQTFNYPALQAGLMLLPITIIMFFASGKFGALAGKFGPRLFMGIGPLICAMGVLYFLLVKDSFNYWTQLFPGIIIFGLGLATTVAPLTAAILGNIDSKHAGVASAVNNAVARVAGLLGVALIGILIGTSPFSATNIAQSILVLHKTALAVCILLAIGGIVSAIGIQNNKSVTTIHD